MRLMRECLPLVLSAALGCAAVAGQQGQAATAKNPAQPGAAKASTTHTPHKTATRRSVHRRHARAALRRHGKRPAYRPEYSENSVEVINGDATKQVVFHEDQPAPTPPSARKLPAGMKNVPAPMKVEVVNGASTDTQYFYDNGQQAETARNQPVVVGIQSSDTRTVGGNQHPVVTSVTSSGATNATSASTGGQPVTKKVSPRPRRRAYQPEPH